MQLCRTGKGVDTMFHQLAGQLLDAHMIGPTSLWQQAPTPKKSISFGGDSEYMDISWISNSSADLCELPSSCLTFCFVFVAMFILGKKFSSKEPKESQTMSCTCQLKRMLRSRSRFARFATGEASDLSLGMRGFTIPGTPYNTKHQALSMHATVVPTAH